MLIDEAGNQKGLLSRGEHKSIQAVRVTLVPGPDDEIAVVNGIFHSFVEDGQSERQIAVDLNARHIKTDLGRDWSLAVVRQLLSNEKYIGNNIWNRHLFKLKKRHVRKKPTSWVRATDAFESIVDPELFHAAKAIFATRAIRFTDEEMLDGLRAALQTNGFLSGIVILRSTNCSARFIPTSFIGLSMRSVT